MQTDQVCGHEKRPSPKAQVRRKCNICGRTFAKSEHLARHVRAHNNERPFRCTTCGKSYGRYDVLLRHQRDTKSHALPAASHPNPLPPIPEEERSLSENPSTSYGEMSHDEPFQHVLAPETVDPMSQSTLPSSSTDTAMSNAGFGGYGPRWNDSLGFDDMFTELGQNYSSWLDVDLLMANNSPPAEVPGLAHASHAPQGNPPDSSGSSELSNLGRLWFTPTADFRDRDNHSRSMTPSGTQTQFDEASCQTLRVSLDISKSEPQLPPAQLMNLCIGLFFSHCQSVIPLIHTPTLHASRTNAVVLLAMCAIGTLCSDSDYLIHEGYKMVHHLQKSTLNKWENMMALSFDTVLSVLQCAILCQTYGLLSGQQDIIHAADSFHGPPVAWAWRFGIFDAKPMSDVDLSVEGGELNRLWRKWVRSEELIRVALSLHLIDAELAKIFHHDPILRFSLRRLQRASSTKVYMAPNAEEWRILYQAEIHNRNVEVTAGLQPAINASIAPFRGVLAATTLLQGIIMRTLEIKAEDSSEKMLESQEDQLVNLYAQFQSADCQKHEGVQFRILWHAAFIYISADVALLEKAAGREACALSRDEEAQISRWSLSKAAPRSYLHALLIAKQAKEVGQDEEFAPHVPLAIFLSGLVWYCYLNHGSKGGVDFRTLVGDWRPRELKAFDFDIRELLSQTTVFDSERSLAWGRLLNIKDLLRRTGHWGISRKYAKILSALLELEFENKRGTNRYLDIGSSP